MVKKLLKQRIAGQNSPSPEQKRLGKQMKAITDAVGEKEMITQNMNWPMLVLRNDFAQ